MTCYFTKSWRVAATTAVFTLLTFLLIGQWARGAVQYSDGWIGVYANGRFYLQLPPTLQSPLSLTQTEAELVVEAGSDQHVFLLPKDTHTIIASHSDLEITHINIQKNVAIHAARLLLNEATLSSGGDLTLVADTLVLRDSAERPFTAHTQGNLTLQGRSLLDIAILSHPNSALHSGGEMRLLSENPVRGDAHYIAGGAFAIAQRDGNAADLLSPTDPIILANGDVSLGSYEGASLHILAGGSVALDEVIINGSDSAANTINLANNATFNGSDRFADLATVTLSDGTAVIIDGSSQPTLDVRAGVDWSTFDAAPGNQVVPNGAVAPAFTAVTDAAITVSGNISVTQPSGVVLLTNQYRPNAALAGNISTRSIDVGVTLPDSDAGSIFLDSRQGIDVWNLNAAALVEGDGVTAGNGGTITALAAAGDFFALNNVSTFSQIPSNNSGNVSSGGDILLRATGDINISDGFGNVWAFAFANDAGTAGDGGDISLISSDGDIIAQSVRADVFALEQVNVGSGGNVLLQANNGAVSLFGDFFSAVRTGVLTFGTAGNAGNVTILAAGDINMFGQSVLANVGGAAGDGGTVLLSSAAGNVSLGEVATTAVSNTTPGQGGNITVQTGSGDITTGSVTAFSNATTINNPAQDGGDITLQTSSGAVQTSSVQSFSTARGQLGDTGNGGDIEIRATFFFTATDDVQSYAFAAQNNSNSGTAGNAGSVLVEAPSGITVQGAIDAYSWANGANGSANNGGDVTLTAVNGPINTEGNISSFANANGFPGFDVEDAGAITLTAGGAIDTDGGSLIANTNSTDGTVGNGGNISATTTGGDVTIGIVNSAATNTFAEFSEGTGNGGNVLLTTENGRISVNEDSTGFVFNAIDSASFGPDLIGNGGSITLAATAGVGINGDVRSQAFGDLGNGGNISIITLAGDISAAALTASSIDNNSTPGSSGDVAVQTGNGNIDLEDVSAVSLALTINNDAQNGGNIAISATGGDVTTGGLTSYAEARGLEGDTGNAGNIDVLSDGRFTTSGPLQAYAWSNINNSNSGSAGSGGNVTVQASTVVSLTGGIQTFSAAPGANGTASDAGSVTVRTEGSLLFGFVDASSSSDTGAVGSGGVVQLRSNTSVQLFGSPFNNSATITAVGLPNSSAITITHGGADVPFTVGDPAANGTVGELTTGDALITPTQSFAGAHFEPPNIWILGNDLADVAIAKTAVPTQAEPGETVQFVLTYSNVGGGLAQSVRITDTLPVELVNVSFVDDGGITAVANETFVWTLPELPIGVSGTITVSGELLTPLAANQLISNTARINTASFELNQEDNSATATVLTLNAAPVALDDRAATGGETAVTVPVLNNDTDANGDALTVTAVGTPDNGTAVTDGTTVTYTPAAGFVGEERVTYTVSDGSRTGEAAVIVTVLEVGEPVVLTSSLFLPTVSRTDPPVEPPPPTPADLIITDFSVTADTVSITIQNAGETATSGQFWVDFYVNPSEPPTINQTWQLIAPEGAAWGVTDSIAGGASLTLTLNSPFYAPSESNFDGLEDGDVVWAYVDIVNLATSNGNVDESDETNNRAGPVVFVE